MRRLLCFLICLSLLSSFAVASQELTLQERLDAYLYSNGLDEENFALSYFNVDTGETYQFNENAFFSAGDVWTLPLHMYYCSEEYHGAFLPAEDDPEFNDPDYKYTIDGMDLNTCRTESILNGNVEVDEAMRAEIAQYENAINEEFGHIPEQNLPEAYYTDNAYSAKFLMNCLLELEREPDIYGELMRLFDLTRQPNAFKSNTLPLTTKYTTVQIRGEQDGMVCAVAEVSAPDTYLLACFVSNDAGGDRILAEINSLICTYVVSTSENGTGDVSSDSSAGFTRSETSFQVNGGNPNDFSGIGKWFLFAIVGVAALVGVLYLLDRLIYSFKHRRRNAKK